MVRTGYKHTEVGNIPEDWNVATLGSLALVSSGGTPSRKNSDFWDGNIPWVTTTLIKGSRIQEAEEFISKHGLNNSAAKLYKSGTILLAMYGQGKTRGKVGYLGINAAINQACAAIVPNRNACAEFIFHFLNGQYKEIRELSNSGGQENLNSEIVKNLYLPIPPTTIEQKAITGALSDVDGLIAGLEALIAKKRAIKTATMQQLLTGKTRLPGFEKGWTSSEIGPHINLLTGFPFPSSQYSKDGTRLLRGSNIKRGKLDWSYELVQYWENVTSDLKRYFLEEGDIVVAMDGSLVGKSFSVMTQSDLPALLLQRVARIRSSTIEPRLLRHWICSNFFTLHCNDVKTVTAIPHISPQDICSFKIDLPLEIEEQVQIANCLDDVLTELECLQSRLTKTKAIKQGMMQELLTGRTRLI